MAIAPAPALDQAATPQRMPIPQPAALEDRSELFTASQPVEIDLVISPIGRLILPAPSGSQQIKFAAALGGQPVTVRAGLRSIHVLLAGEVIRTRPSRLTLADLEHLRLRGRPAGPEPAAAAAPLGAVPVGTAMEIERTVGRDGDVVVAGIKLKIGTYMAGQQVVLRLERNLAHVVADGYLVKTLPAPIAPEHAARMTGARTAQGLLPPTRPGTVKLMRTVPADGITQVAGQRLRVGRARRQDRHDPGRGHRLPNSAQRHRDQHAHPQDGWADHPSANQPARSATLTARHPRPPAESELQQEPTINRALVKSPAARAAAGMVK